MDDHEVPMMFLLLSCSFLTDTDPVVLLRSSNQITCALRASGALLCWGGAGMEPALRLPPEGEYVDVDVDLKWACGVTRGGEIRCWGENPLSQESPPADTDFKQVILQGFKGCGLHNSGALSCWNYRSPYKTPPEHIRFQHISGSGIVNCGITTNDEIACWGIKGAMEAPPVGLFQSVDVDSHHACAVTTDGRGQCWGDNTSGRNNVPDASFQQIKSGGDHACGLTTSGEILCWGRSDWGETDLPSGKWAYLEVANAFACAINTEGRVRCWGEEIYSGTVPEAIAAD